MATFVFSGDPRAPGTDPDECGIFGMTFPFNQPVNVDDERVAEKLRRHTHFTEIKDGDQAPAATPAEAEDLHGISIADLRMMAANRGIDVEGLKKAEIRAKLRGG